MLRRVAAVSFLSNCVCVLIICCCFGARVAMWGISISLLLVEALLVLNLNFFLEGLDLTQWIVVAVAPGVCVDFIFHGHFYAEDETVWWSLFHCVMTSLIATSPLLFANTVVLQRFGISYALLLITGLMHATPIATPSSNLFCRREKREEEWQRVPLPDPKV